MPAPHVVSTPKAKRRTFPGRPEQVARARKFTAAVLGSCPLTDDAVLLVSELATNAIQHGGSGLGGTFKVTVCHYPARLYVGVTDEGSATAPVLVPAADLAPSGRGLYLVAQIATSWGHERSGRSGRIVWFGMDCP
jgi:serine/threonine-protein kinase RsbW